MTVRELIEKLQTLDPALPVLVPADDYERDGLVDCQVGLYAMGDPAFVCISPID